jgi:hypothetical protein
MKRTFSQRFPKMTATEFIQSRLRDADFEKKIHIDGNGALLEWLPSKYSCLIRFRMNVGWSEPLKRMLGTNEVDVRETRSFQADNSRQTVASTLKTNLPFLSANIKRSVEDCKDGCVETLSLEIIYQGDTFRDQIANDFFRAIAKHIFPLNSNEVITSPIANKPATGLFVPPKHATQYIELHSQLQDLRESSERYSNILEEAKIDRKPLRIPNANQINQVCALLEPKRFSMEDEIAQMDAETQRAQRIVGGIKKAREQLSSGSTLPVFILATCAAVIFYVANNT